ncbi:MAG: helix-turn-helix domain containing protein [Candidatus Binatia bacterium]|nr:helix-turn-helix domain containing protein [Candidatus Binatia bacterium]
MGRASSVPRARAARRPAAERRAEILRTAMKAFAQKGYRETGTADIAREIGISEPTLYRYFDSKRELYLEAIELGSGEILSRWHEMARESATPVDALIGLGIWYFEDLQRDTSTLMLRARAEIETEDPEVNEKLRAHFLETFDFVLGLYQQAEKAELIPAGLDLRARTWLFISLGSLIDRTELLGLRERLDMAEIGQVITALAPELAPAPPTHSAKGR